MIKSLGILVATIFFSFAQNYDPKTGELIQKDVYDLVTGELKEQIEQKYIGKTIQVELKSGESISGIVKQENNSTLIVETNDFGALQLNRNTIKAIVEQIGSAESVDQTNSTNKKADPTVKNITKKNNKVRIKKKVELKTGEVIVGYLIDNNYNHAIIYSSTIDTVMIQKEKINTITDYIDMSKTNEQPRWVQERIKKPKNNQPQGLPSMEELKQAGEAIGILAVMIIYLMFEFNSV